MRESNLRRLLRHGASDFRHAMTNADDRCLSGSVEKSPAVVSDDPAAFPTRGNRQGLLEIAGEKSATRRHEMSGKGLYQSREQCQRHGYKSFTRRGAAPMRTGLLESEEKRDIIRRPARVVLQDLIPHPALRFIVFHGR